MKNSKLITTIILSQAALIFIGFKIPEKKDKEIIMHKEKADHEIVYSIKPTNYILEKKAAGTINGVSYNLVYPFLETTNVLANKKFNKKIINKLGVVNSQFGFGNELTDLCDESLKSANITQQYLDYKLYNHNDSIISLLLMKGDYFNEEPTPKFSFKTLNYDLDKGDFLKFEDVFLEESKESFVTLANKYSKTKLLTSNCQEILMDDFEYYKNNFVIGNASIKFYFDECIMCYQESGEYTIEIPIEHIKPLMVNPNVIKGLTNILK